MKMRMKMLCSLPREKTSRLLMFLFTLTSILLLACEAKIVSAGGGDALPPENFRAVVLNEQGNPSPDLTLRGASDHSSSSMNPVYYWKNISNNDLRNGIKRSFVLLSNRSMSFVLDDWKVVEEPANIKVKVSPFGLDSDKEGLSGIFLNRSTPLLFDVELSSDEDILPQNYRIRLNCHFSTDTASNRGLYSTISIILNITDSQQPALVMLERGVATTTSEDSFDFSGMIASFDENRYYDDNSAPLTEESVYAIDRKTYAATRKDGLAADGNTRLMLIATSFSSGDIAFSLKNNVDKIDISAFSLETLNRVKGTIDGWGDLTLRISPVLVDGGKGVYQCTAVLVAPEGLIPKLKNDSEVDVQLETCQYEEDGLTVLQERRNTRSIRLCRAPFVLLHGLNGYPEMFGLESNVNTFFAKLKAISTGNPGSLEYTGYNAPKNIMAEYEGRFLKQIKTRFQDMNRQGIASSRVDMVAYSMGGLVARYFIQNYAGNMAEKQGYQRGLVRRLVTLGTPHMGSAWANYIIGDFDGLYLDRDPDDPISPFVQWLINHREYLVNFVHNMLNTLNGVPTPFIWERCLWHYKAVNFAQKDPSNPDKDVGLFPLLDKEGKPYDAFKTLARNSEVLKTLNSENLDRDVLVHAISGNTVSMFFNNEDAISDVHTLLTGFSFLAGHLFNDFSLLSLSFLLSFIPDDDFIYSVQDLGRAIFGGSQDAVNDNDMIVSNGSSRWKFWNYHTVFRASDWKTLREFMHVGLTNSPTVIDEVIELLTGPSSNFISLRDAARNAPPPDEGNVIPRSNIISSDVEDIFPEITEERISLTADKTELTPGETVNLRAELPGVLGASGGNMTVVISQVEQSGFTFLEAKGNGVWEGTLLITRQNTGAIVLRAMKLDPENKVMYVSNSLILNVSPALQTVMGIKFQNQPLILAENTAEKITLLAVEKQNGEMINISDTSLGITYSTDDPSIAEVLQRGPSESGLGVIRGKRRGRTILRAHWKDFEAVTPVYVMPAEDMEEEIGIPVASVAVAPDSADLQIGGTLKLTASVLPEDATDKNVTWSSTQPEVATVDGEGNVSALSEGTAHIRALAADGVHSADCAVTVRRAVIPVSSIAVLPGTLTLDINGTAQLTVSITPPDATDIAVTWSTTNSSVATVDEEGNVSALSEGTAHIRALAADGVHSADCAVTVRRAVIPVSSIAVLPGTLTLDINGTAQLTASITPPDATDTVVTWSTTNSSVATVDAQGLVRAVGTGSATITASVGGQAASCSVTVNSTGGGGGTGGGSEERRAYYSGKYPGKNIYVANDDGEALTGTDNNDVLVSGPGDDWLEGGEGNDIYVYEAGGGHDIISNISAGEDDQDELHFGPGISQEDLVFSRNDDDLEITVLIGDGSVTIEDWYKDDRNKLARIVFDDGSVLTREEIEYLVENPPVVFYCSGGNINISSRAGDIVIVYGSDVTDNIYCGKGNEIVIAGPGDDYIRDRTDYNGGGNNTFVYNRDGGHDTVDYYYGGHTPGDGIGKLKFGTGIAPEEIDVTIKGNNVTFSLTDGSGSVTFLNANSGNVFYCIDTITFADGTVWTWSEAATRKVMRGTEGDDTLNVVSRAGDTVAVYSLGGNDNIYGGKGNETYTGGPGNDYIRDRTDYNGGGNNTFIYNLGDGHDRIDYYNNGHKSGDGIGKLKFGAGISPSDVDMGISGNSAVFTLTDGSGSVTFLNANSGNVFYCIDEIEFADGTVWKWADALKGMIVRGTENDDVMNVASRAGDVLTIYGLGGNDKIYSGPGDDTFIGGPGNDYIRDRTDYNGGGNNTFVYNRGDGYDTVDYYYKGHVHGDGIGKLRFGPGISPDDVYMGINGNNVVFTLTDGSGSVTFTNANSNNVFYCVDTIEFNDGTVWRWTEGLKRMVIRGTENDDVMNVASRAGDVLTVYGLGGNDKIYSGPGDDTFIGGPGNDYIRDRTDYNGGGNNTFVYNRGDGHDTVDYYYKGHVHGDGIGKLRFGPGISPSGVDMGIIGNNVIFTLTDGSGSVTFLNANSGNVFYCIDEIEFADGTVWKWADALKGMIVRGTENDDVMNVASRAGQVLTVYGLGGNDRIYSGPGDDTFIGGPGNDYIRDRTDYNGGGNNTFVYNRGDGHDTVDYYYKGHVHGDGIGKLRFGPEISPASVDMGIIGNNVVFTLIDGTGSVTFLNANSGNVFYCIDEIEFADETIWKWSEALKRMVVRGTVSDDVLNITSRSGDIVAVYGLGGNDRIYSGPGDDTFVGGPGDDYIRDRTDYNGGGNNTFVYNKGDGYDTVDYYYKGHVHGDGIGKLRFGPGISPASVDMGISGNNVVFTLIDGTGSITFLNANSGNVFYCIDEIAFTDGTIWKWADALKGMVVRGTDDNDVLNITSRVGDNVTVYGLGGDDRIYSGSGNDTFVGGPGDDYIRDRTDYNGGGNNTFVYNLGDGHDTVDYYYRGHVHGDGIGKLKFGKGIRSDDVTVSISGNNVVFSITGGSGSVKFLNAATSNTCYRPDTIEFNDGTSRKWNEMVH